MLGLLFTIVWLLSLMKAEITNLTPNLKFKPEELEIKEKTDSLVAIPLFSRMHNLSSKLETEDYCSDVQPPESKLSCQQIYELGLCGSLLPQFCKLSCKNCVCYTPLCQIISNNGLCEYFITQGYCLQECKNTSYAQTEAQALLSIKASMQNPDRMLSWFGVDACNGWAGVICKNGHVSELRLGSRYYNFEADQWINVQGNQILKNVQTSIPPQLSSLRYLNGLWLSDSGFSGALPRELSTLSDLMWIDLYISNLTGTIPLELSTLSDLIWINLCKSNLGTTIPLEFSTWNKVQILDMSQNEINGTLPPQLSTWTSLNSLHAHSNLITGTLPPQFSTWTSLQAYEVYDNKISGILPPQFSTWKLLEQFIVSLCYLTGAIPLQYSTWQNITTYYFCYNTSSSLCQPSNFYLYTYCANC